MNQTLVLLLCLLSVSLRAQSPAEQLAALERQKSELKDAMTVLDTRIEQSKLSIIATELASFGIPAVESDETLIAHAAMALVYSEVHEQAKWVSHVITPDVITGRGYRTNDFRPDPKVQTGTAVEEDYFLKTPKSDGSFEYDGFGYDRGHLAPSADFRWSKQALSESYFYSNMSPQLANFNREIWADLENEVRGYLYRNPNARLYVTTGGILSSDLPVIERSKNKVAIPDYFYKVIIDRNNQRGIGFLLPHQPSNLPLETFALTIDEIEARTGLDFYTGLPDTEETQLESSIDKIAWLPELQDGNVESLRLQNMPRKKSYPATFAQEFMNKDIKVNICGTVVGGRYSRKGNLLLNVDKKFPNQIFTIFVRKEHLPNFSYDPVTLVNSQVCAKGVVNATGSTPTMFIKDEKKLDIIDKQ